MTEDVNVMVEAVLDVLAPKPDPGALAGMGFELAETLATLRMPVILLDYDGVAVQPNDEQLRGLAEHIVTAIRTATHPPVWQPSRGLSDGSEERPVAGGLLGKVGPSSRNPGAWVWNVVAPIPGGGASYKGGGYAADEPEAKAAVGTWEKNNTTPDPQVTAGGGAAAKAGWDLAAAPDPVLDDRDPDPFGEGDALY